MRGTWRDLELPGQVTPVGEAFQALKQAGKSGDTVLTKAEWRGLVLLLVSCPVYWGQPVYHPSGPEFLILFIPFDGSTIRSP